MSFGPRLVLDTSCAVPLLLAAHKSHETVKLWAQNRQFGLTSHSLAETYAVLTRLPGDARVSHNDAVLLIDDNFAWVLSLPSRVESRVHMELASRNVSGGATYDGLVALAARENDAVLVTRDARARSTYELLGANVEFLVDPGLSG